MLRSGVLLTGGVALLCGAIALFAHTSPGLVFVFWGALIVLSILYERFRYKPLEGVAPGPGWTKTPERFIDDETGEPVTVWINASGERKYVRG